MQSFENTYKNKNVLITGHTGFKGSWLSLWLSKLGANVIGVSNLIPSDPSHFNAINLKNNILDYRLDIRDQEKIKDLIIEHQPEFVFHLAAQPLVKYSYDNPIETITTNSIGTSNILDSLLYIKNQVVAVMITSDKVYDNVEWVWGYKETDRIGGKDPYSASKGMAELAIRTYVESFFNTPDSPVKVGIARAGNVIGGGDWARDRIVVDCIKSWSKGEVVDIRNPNATRPWQHVLEPLSGYLSLGDHLQKNASIHGQAYNFGPPANQNYSVKDLIEEMGKTWENVRWNDISGDISHVYESGLLKLNCDKALFDLKWLPSLNFEQTVRMTVDWYKRFYEADREDMYDLSANQITDFQKIAKNNGIEWAKK